MAGEVARPVVRCVFFNHLRHGNQHTVHRAKRLVVALVEAAQTVGMTE
jgi:hypothetical protein